MDNDTKIRGRQTANLGLLLTLGDLIQENPDLRWGQILVNFGFVERLPDGNWKDEYYSEPMDLFDRVNETVRKAQLPQP